MPPTRRELLRLSASSGFEPPILEKTVRLGEILAAVARHAGLSEAVVLKGGTALNLFFGPPTRLSVDLDFNYVGELEREAAARERPVVERDLERIARAQGYAVQRSRDAHAGRKLYLSFRRTIDDLRDRVEIDVNFLHRQQLIGSAPPRMWQPAEAPACEFPVLAPEVGRASDLGPSTSWPPGSSSPCWTARQPATPGTWHIWPRSRPSRGPPPGHAPSSSPWPARCRGHFIPTRSAVSRGSPTSTWRGCFIPCW